MKTLVRLIRRYVLLAVGLSLLLIVLGLALIIWVGIRFGLVWQEQFRYSYMEIADQLQQDDSGSLSFGEQDASYWLNGYAWAMVLDDDGEVIWEYQLPQELERRYTAPEIAVFSHWYLDDYPVFCQVRDYGLLVLGMPRDSIWKYSFWTYPELINWLFYRGTTVMGGVLVLILVLCLLFSWRGAKSLGVVADGLDTLAEGRTVNSSTKGFAGELAEKLNRTSAQIRSRNEIIRQRDTARTNWIAGVSHDIRTPLSLILGWAEQLQKNDALPEETRRKAEGICQQSEKIRALVEDLNLTSKLQYGAQPLRRKEAHAGPLLRQMVADFCNGPLAGDSEVELVISREAETATLQVDEALLARAVENILGNSVRHNPGTVRCRVAVSVTDRSLCIAITDDGTGFPDRVLEALQTGCVEENTPHILGLHVVEQILQAHGGTVLFSQNEPRGSRVEMRLPIA